MTQNTAIYFVPKMYHNIGFYKKMPLCFLTMYCVHQWKGGG
jgi:hypothetical protein